MRAVTPAFPLLDDLAAVFFDVLWMEQAYAKELQKCINEFSKDKAR